MHFITDLIARFGYLGIFSLLMFGLFGLPVPDETLLTFCGYMVSKGDLLLIPTILAAFLGSCSGVSVSYLLGLKLGLPAIRKFGKYIHLDEKHLDTVHRWFRGIGHWVLTFGYFIPGFRHITAIVAGTSCLEYGKFAPFAYLGALLWSTAFVTLGYYVGNRWETMSGRMHDILLVVFIAFSSLTLVLALVRWIISRRRKRRGTAAG